MSRWTLPAAGVPCELGATGNLTAEGAEASDEDASPARPPELGWLREASSRCGLLPLPAEAAAEEDAERPSVKDVAGDVDAMAVQGSGAAAPLSSGTADNLRVGPYGLGTHTGPLSARHAAPDFLRSECGFG